MSAQPIPEPISREEYLAADLASEERLEFVGGVITAMSGVSYPHSTILGNLSLTLGSRLKDRSCRPHTSDLRVSTPSHDSYFYPDCLVVCDKPVFEEETFDTLTNPTVLFEILSPSTEARDRGEKFWHYRTIPTMQEYVLLSQSAAVVETYRRDGEQWVLTIAQGLDANMRLESLGIEMPLRELYLDVEFTKQMPGPSS